MMTGNAVTDLDLQGDSLCLDYANTVDPRVGPRARDFLTSPADLAGWGVHAGIVEVPPRLAAHDLELAVEAREAIYRLFRRLAGGREPAEGDLDIVQRCWRGALGDARLVPEGPVIVWRAVRPGVASILIPVLDDVFRLLQSGNAQRVRICDGDDCGWLFLDRTKNGSRRWCSMEICGSRAKMRRYRERQRSATEAGAS